MTRTGRRKGDGVVVDGFDGSRDWFNSFLGFDSSLILCYVKRSFINLVHTRQLAALRRARGTPLTTIALPNTDDIRTTTLPHLNQVSMDALPTEILAPILQYVLRSGYATFHFNDNIKEHLKYILLRDATLKTLTSVCTLWRAVIQTAQLAPPTIMISFPSTFSLNYVNTDHSGTRPLEVVLDFSGQVWLRPKRTSRIIREIRETGSRWRSLVIDDSRLMDADMKDTIMPLELPNMTEIILFTRVHHTNVLTWLETLQARADSVDRFTLVNVSPGLQRWLPEITSYVTLSRLSMLTLVGCTAEIVVFVLLVVEIPLLESLILKNMGPWHDRCASFPVSLPANALPSLRLLQIEDSHPACTGYILTTLRESSLGRSAVEVRVDGKPASIDQKPGWTMLQRPSQE